MASVTELLEIVVFEMLRLSVAALVVLRAESPPPPKEAVERESNDLKMDEAQGSEHKMESAPPSPSDELLKIVSSESLTDAQSTIAIAPPSPVAEAFETKTPSMTTLATF